MADPLFEFPMMSEARASHMFRLGLPFRPPSKIPDDEWVEEVDAAREKSNGDGPGEHEPSDLLENG